MKLILNRLSTLNDLYENQLQMLLSAEEQVASLLVDMQGWASDAELRSTFRQDQKDAEHQVERIRSLLSAHEAEIRPVKSKVLEALAAETEDLAGDAANTTVRDVAMITAAQRVKHYEIAVYGAIRDFARILGKRADEALLDATLEEEKDGDRNLTAIAERINRDSRAAA